MAQMTFLSVSIQKIAGIVGAIAVIVGAVFGFDARYNNQSTLFAIEGVKSQVVTEIALNRGAMISILQGEADDLEFEIVDYEQRGEVAPRYIVEKLKRTQRTIERLQSNEDINQFPVD